MKLAQVSYDNDEEIKDITVTMSRAEAIAIVNIAGQLNSHAETKLKLAEDDSLYDTLASVMIRHYDDGAPDLNIDLKTINES